ncbi:cytochrome B6 [Pendulispora albinea]|uniref:Cytochrome B6 n=1 Tax=Pendulispora albinea TaxID=2741071 RepID=A0ABZ2M9N3_9BACT
MKRLLLRSHSHSRSSCATWVKCLGASLLVAAGLAACGEGGGTGTAAQSTGADRVFPNPTSPPPTLGDFDGDFAAFMAKAAALKPEIMQRQMALLQLRYDLANRAEGGPASCKTSRGKPVQTGVRVKTPPGLGFRELAGMTPAAIKDADAFPAGFLPLPHPNHPVGGMVFPVSSIDGIKRQTGRDLTRFDLDFDLPEHLLPEFPPAIFLTTRKDLGDVSRGQLVTTENFWALFKDILNPKQLDGLRLLLTPFPQQQFNLTSDRNSARPSLGVACFDCHINGSTNGATHQVGDIRPQAMRNRIDTTSLRGVAMQPIFGSQRGLASVEDFTEFEQRAAYFDGDPEAATRKGLNPLERGSQVHNMAEMQKILDFPPSKLDPLGKLDRSRATESELRGEGLFFGKAQCATCHSGVAFTDGTLHDLQVERFFRHRLINGQQTKDDGPIKTFTLRGVKDTPPYFHDGRLLTLDDTVEFFNLVLGLRLGDDEKQDLVAYMCAL